MPNLLERKMYRLKYQYELAELLLDKDRRQIRDAMRYKGMDNTSEDIAQYIMDTLAE